MIHYPKFSLLPLVIILGCPSTPHAQNPTDPLAPENALGNLELHPGLEATLFTSEPTISSVTNLDIDYRGRVWVCEVMNYREHGAKSTRPEGDRILILEDEDGDGVADTSKTYYQGHDVDAALGICVLGNQVIVTCAPNILIFTDEDGDDQPDRKEYLFTNTGNIQDDHSTHSVIFGPDGKLYWNMGNHGKFVHDRDGNLVIDQAGNPVFDRNYSEEVPGFKSDDTPYWGGMIFRCNPDGSKLETLAHNFRNNYEVAIDSFGGLWQSDNDDDGNFGVRLNYILEYGNYGYLEEYSGAGWREPRISQHPEIPKRHWHQNDPGVVPNFVQLGAGSPTGITVYEGDLLPELFQNQVIHCDAGPGVVWAAIKETDGAGYQGKMVNLLKESKRGWMRPVDAATAPDGSLFVTDWYDPVVSWNRQYDVPRGRIYRISPKGHPYLPQASGFDSPANAAKALESPNSDARYLARKALLGFEPEKAIPVLKDLFNNSNARIRARALWLLAELEESDTSSLKTALLDPDPDIRVTAIRAARQQAPDLPGYLRAVANDSSARVRSEAAIALRNLDSMAVPELWAQLANQLDPDDRWNLEALGIAADGRWDRCLDAWIAAGGNWKSASGRKIIWRSRGSHTPNYLEKCLNLQSIPLDEIRLLLRAFDFQQQSGIKEKALWNLASNRWTDHTEAGWLIGSEAFQRLKGFGFSQTTPFEERLEAFLDQAPLNEAYLKVIAGFHKTQYYPAILNLLSDETSGTLQSLALRSLLDANQQALLSNKLKAVTDNERSALIQVLTTSHDNRVVPLLTQVLLSEDFPLKHRKQATMALGALRSGAVALVSLGRENRFPEILKPTAGAALTQTLHVRAFAEAANYFPIPQMKGSKRVPGMTDLVVLQGNKDRGKEVFQEGTCATCHQINGEGINFGPDLSLIGTKLAKTGLYEAILNPSASVSESYQTTTVALMDGTTHTGLLVSETNQSISLLLPGGVKMNYLQSEIDKLTQSPESLMPPGLQQLMTLDDLVDLTEYLSSLQSP